MNPEIENVILKNNVKEREISDNRYAPALIKNIVFGLISLLLIAMVGTLTGVFDKKADNILVGEEGND